MNDARLDEPQNELQPLDRLNTRFDQMEQRIAALESRINSLERAAGAAELPVAPSTGTAAASPLLPAVPDLQTAGSIFPVFGRALLGIAGAYLLRAINAAHVLPEALMEFAGIAYALLWLIFGARARTALAAVTFACTSVLILAPMLWELTMSFRTMPAWAGAGALAAFATVGFALVGDEKKARPQGIVLRIANLSAAALCLILAVVTHQNLPFLVVLLLLTGACEYASLRSQLRCGRPLVALAADMAVWLLIFIYRAPDIARTDYASLPAFSLVTPGFVLFGICATGVAIRASRISVFDTLQVTASFLLASCGLLYFGPSAKEIILGCLCLVLAAALYAASLAFPNSDGRNQAVFSIWSAALLLASIWLVVPVAARSTTFAITAIVATAAGTALRQTSLVWNGVLFLVVSASISGLPAYAFYALTGTATGAPSLAICAAALGAVLCYAIIRFRLQQGNHTRALAFLFAAVAALAAAALLVQECTRFAAAFYQPGPHHLALLRSLILCAAALALAFSGARWRRPELSQIGYGVVALEAVKLLAEDLRHGHLAYVAASVCLFAFTLIAIPRVSRRSPNRPSAA